MPQAFQNTDSIDNSPEEGGEAWRCLEGPLPNKVFVWDKDGAYMDCVFPNPRYGHFLGGEALKGKHVQEVLSEESAKVVHRGIRSVLRDRKPSLAWIELGAGLTRHRVCIRFIPGYQYVIGLVNDFPVGKDQKIGKLLPYIRDGRLVRGTMPLLSIQEQTIIKKVREGRSNKGIASQLSIEVRTVKYHLSNIYRKLHITSRLQLARIAPFYLQPFSDDSEDQGNHID